MRERLPLILSAAALLVALLGATPVGPGVRDAVASVVPVPFAKQADRAKLADNALRLNGRRSSTTPKPGTIPVVGRNGKLSAALGAIGPRGAVGPQGPRGDSGAKGDTGPKGDRGPEGLVNAYTTLGVGQTQATPTAGYATILSLPLPAGRYVIFGRVHMGQGGQAQYSGFCRVVAGATTDTGSTQGVKNPTVGGVGSASDVVATVMHDFAAAGTALLQCWSPPSAPTSYSNARLTALQIKSS
jgi:hypothetical protein